MTGKQRAIDLAKVAIINAVETGIETKSEIARRYELPRSTLSTILKNKEKFKHLFATSQLKLGIKHCRLATYQDVEEALFSIRAYYDNQGKRVSFKDGSFRVSV